MSGIVMTLIGSLAGVAKDTFFRYVTLLLPGNGTNGAQNNTFLDGSTNNFTITRNGNTTQGTFTPFGSNWSNYFDGTGDYLDPASSANLNVGTGQFTIEAWIFETGTATGYSAIYALGPGYDTALYLNGTSRNLVFYINTLGAVVTSTAGAARNTWHHVAVTRDSSNVLRIFLNGVANSAGTRTDNFNHNSPRIGASLIASELFTGYISNVRILKGTALYTANFTPPTAPLTAITNTQLLTCQSNRFIDNSTNNFTITRNGDVSVQRFSPFSPTDAYSASVIGGSGYFDGNGDYLTVADSANLELGSGDWTIEGWFYVTSGTTSRQLYGRDNDTGADVLIRLGTGANNLEVYLSSNGTTFAISSTAAISGAPVNYNAWNHFAVTSSGGTIRKGINGVMNSIGTLASIVNSTKTWYVGARLLSGGPTVSEFFPGYISNLRVLVGTAQYAAATYTVPTAPLTAITNTSLLLNFTNAGIIDNAMMNDLETVANAQISTTQSKFGGSSMYFDGTGDYLTSNAPSGLALYSIGANEQFTVEMWVYRVGNGTGGSATLDAIIGSNNGAFSIWGVYVNRSTRVISFNNSAGLSSTSGSITDNTWTHIAVTRDSSNTLRIFINGVSGFSGSNTGTGTLVNPLYIGRDGTGASGNSNFNGYIDDLRITKGVARYTANFTPPSQAFPTS